MKWIPVSERLPDGSVDVLTWDGHRMEVMFWWKSEDMWTGLTDIHSEPTHWMPLPQPPEEK